MAEKAKRKKTGGRKKGVPNKQTALLKDAILTAAQRAGGAEQRAIEAEGIAQDYGQFREERDFPYKQLAFQSSLLQGLPIAAQSYSYSQPSTLSTILGEGSGLLKLLGIGGDSSGKKEGDGGGDK